MCRHATQRRISRRSDRGAGLAPGRGRSAPGSSWRSGSTAPPSPGACASGWLHPLHRGVYAVGHTALTATGRWFAAVLACGDGAVLQPPPRRGGVGAAPDAERPGRRDGPARRTQAPCQACGIHRTVARCRERTAHRWPGRSPRPNARCSIIATAFWRCRSSSRRSSRPSGGTWSIGSSSTGSPPRARPGAPALRSALAEPFVVTRSVLERRLLGLVQGATGSRCREVNRRGLRLRGRLLVAGAPAGRRDRWGAPPQPTRLRATIASRDADLTRRRLPRGPLHAPAASSTSRRGSLRG